MRSAVLAFALVASVGLALVSCTSPLTTPIEEIPKLQTLKDVMRNQATDADAQWPKIGNESFTDAEFTAFGEVSKRIGVTSLKIKDFSKGPDFDALAQRLHDKAEALGTAAAAKDVAGSNTALTEMKATCKECHSKFR